MKLAIPAAYVEIRRQWQYGSDRAASTDMWKSPGAADHSADSARNLRGKQLINTVYKAFMEPCP
jgi:hypothetical protein